MPKFEVTVVYKGQVNYVVEAKDEEEAETLAADSFHQSNPAGQVTLGNEWESIENIESYEIHEKATQP